MLAQLAPVKGVLHLHRFENEAIVCAKTTNEYFQYLFETRDCFHIRSARLGQIYLLYIYGIVLKLHCSIRSFMSTGPSSKLNCSDMASTYRPTLQKNLLSEFFALRSSRRFIAGSTILSPLSNDFCNCLNNCLNCGALLKPKQRDCFVYCSYAM